MILLDTGYLLAIARPQDALHRRAWAWARVVSEPLLVTHYVLSEAVNELSKPRERDRAHALLDLVMRDPQYDVISGTDALFSAGVSFHAIYRDKSWSLTDCISFHVMRDRGIHRALAYDHHFEQAGFEAMLRHDPP